jgi:hypothetical protein
MASLCIAHVPVAAMLPQRRREYQEKGGSRGRFRENHAILSNQRFATGRVAFGDWKNPRNDQWETIDFHG